MMELVEILPLTAADLPRVMELERESFSDPWSEAAMAATLSIPVVRGLAARVDGETVGFALAYLIPPEGEIYRVATHPDRLRQGIGEALCAAFLSLCETVFLEVRRSNLPARTLYEKLGFVLTGERKKYYKDPMEDACLYTRG